MEKLFKNPTARRSSCTVDGLLAVINHMDEGLEKIQKSLDQYLETKRMVLVFHRFYFVSDDHLLEILGQGKDSMMAVQKHIKKCFEGFVTLDLFSITEGLRE